MNQEIEKEKIENLKDIEEEISEKRRQLQNDFNADKAKAAGKEMVS